MAKEVQTRSHLSRASTSSVGLADRGDSTAAGITSAACTSGTARRLTSRQHDLISAPVQLVSSGREQFTVGMKRSGGRCALFGGEGFTDTKPREGKFHGGHCGAESLGGVGGGLGDGIVGWLGCRPAGCVLAGVVGCGGCCGHIGFL